ILPVQEKTEGRERPEPLTDVELGIIQDTWARVYESCEDVGVFILIRCNKSDRENKSDIKNHDCIVCGAISSLMGSLILSGVMLEILAEDFGECFTPEVHTSWTKLMAALYWYITVAYTEVGWLKLSSSAI
uniref:superoxide dismutase n=1 Tax=Sinocyclocheilus anshuiensis TaxID=1608454 RepID=A0A671K1K5_9TELE